MKVSFLLPRSARGRLLPALLVSLAGGLTGGLAVAVLNRALDADEAGLPALGAWFIAASLAMWAARVWSHTQFVRFSQDVLVHLRLQVSRHFASVPYRELEALGPARMLAILLEDVRVAAEVLVTVPRLAMQAAAILAGLAHLAYLSWSAFAFTVILIVVGSLAHVGLEKRAARFLRGARRAEDRLYEHLRGLVAGAKELKLNAARRNAFLEQVLSPSIADVRAQRTRGLSMHAVAGSFGAFLFFAVIGAVTFFGSALHESSAVQSGYALTLLFLMHPIEGLLEMVPTFSRARIAFERIADSGVQFYEQPTRDPGAEPVSARHTVPPRVVLHDVTHRYRRDSEDGVFVVGPIRLELAPGETVFVIGGNGSGKTTLAKLLVGLYAPEGGRVWLGGDPSNATDAAEHGEYFSAIFSDYHLFREVLDTSAEGVDRARRWFAELGLAHKVSINGGRFSTTELSSGQRKRLALVALLLEDRPICVFDEWASDQDPAYKRAFYCELLPALKARGKTVLVITHDERYFHLADRCIMLEAGKIVGSYAPSRRATSQMSTPTY